MPPHDPAAPSPPPIRARLSFQRIPVSPAAWRTYALLALFLVLVKLVFTLFPTPFPGADQDSAFAWPTIAMIVAMGAVGMALAPFAGFPDLREPAVGARQRWMVPALAGAVYGVVTALGDLGQPADVHLRFPQSVPFYAYGATFLEIMLRLFALTLVAWLLGVMLRRWRQAGREVAFWTANVLAALYEPMPLIQAELADAERLAAPGILVGWAFEPLFLANLLTGWFYRRAGFLAALAFRLGFYLVWHVAYGGFRGFWLSL